MFERTARETLGSGLVRAHDRLRRDLRSVQNGTSATFPADCLAFCTLLTAHHTAEDGDVFTALVDAEPALAPTVHKLREDHVIAGLLSRVRELAEQQDDAALAELDGVAAIMESHFRFEERTVRAALDRLDAEGLSPLLPD